MEGERYSRLEYNPFGLVLVGILWLTELIARMSGSSILKDGGGFPALLAISVLFLLFITSQSQRISVTNNKVIVKRAKNDSVTYDLDRIASVEVLNTAVDTRTYINPVTLLLFFGPASDKGNGVMLTFGDGTSAFVGSNHPHALASALREVKAERA